MLIYRDKAGNTLKLDLDSRLAVRNKEGELVNPTGSRKFLKRPGVKRAIREKLGKVRPRQLSPEETRQKASIGFGNFRNIGF